MASRPNGFLIDAFEDRETLLASSVANHNIDELKNLVDRFAARTERIRNERFQNNLDTIVNCVAFKRSCGMGVGKWLKLHCAGWDQKKKSKIINLCKFSAGIFRNWDLIVHNLTDASMSQVDARDFTLRKLYEARNISFCQREKRQNTSEEVTSKPDEVNQEYDETKYIRNLEHIKNSEILNDVSFDPSQANLIASRIKDDLQKLCKEAGET